MSTFTGTLAAWYVAGHKLIDTESKTWFDALEALSDPRTAFTPAWKSTGTAPALGNGTITGRYVQVGKYVTYSGKLTMGSTTTFGTGVYQISLRCLRSTPTASVARRRSVPHPLPIPASRTSAGTSLLKFFGDTGVGQYTNLIPFTWAANDVLLWSITYEAA